MGPARSGGAVSKGIHLLQDPRLGRLYELMRRVNSSTDTAGVLEEIVAGVTDGLGYGVAAISRIQGDTLVVSTFSGPEHYRAQVLGRRRPVQLILDAFDQADEWGIIRYVPRGRVAGEFLEGMWVPDCDPVEGADAWHPGDALFGPLYAPTGELLGIMSVDRPPGGRVPDQQQRELLEMFVVQAGLALSHAQHRARLAEQLVVGEMLTKVALAGSLVDLDLVLEAAVRAVAEGLDSCQTWLRCFPETLNGSWEHAAGYPAPNAVTAGIQTLLGDLVRLSEADHGFPIEVGLEPDPSDLLPMSGQALQHKMRLHDATQAAVCPMLVGRDVLGYLVVMRSADQPALTPPQRAGLAEVGRTLGPLVLNARLRSTEQRLLAELQELDRYKGELIATISHELKTPLTSIMGHTELLEDGASLDVSLPAITRNAHRLQGLIDNLLSYSRLQEKRSPARQEVDLAGLVRGSIETLAVQLDRQALSVSLDAPHGPVSVVGDPEELRRVCDNLLGNAVKYSRPGGRVSVQVGGDADGAWLSVSDQGLGISRQDQVHLFSAFHRSSNPEALSIPGTGLGLAISRRIVELHEGTVTVDSTLGQGSTFTVRLPRRPDSPRLG
ncbi:sensor histidine kinase [Nocardioides houyundeii]|uniref:sensor histidine kinase n=1 Tax=Nocardioides houyundeii TaxID=2045452 RepID=UPI0013150794|nr:HAMP domain-containing sensor histidine kinase [Nocardioides houyundeii]